MCAVVTRRPSDWRTRTPPPVTRRFSSNNLLNVQFALYSTLADAQADQNRWAFCNYDDFNVGFPRDCGPTGFVGGQWNSIIVSAQPNVRFTIFETA